MPPYKPRMVYDPAVKAKAVSEVVDNNVQAGVVARRYHINPRTLYKWCTDYRNELYRQAGIERGGVTEVTDPAVIESMFGQTLPEAVVTEPELIETEESAEREFVSEAQLIDHLDEEIEELKAEVNRLKQQLVQRTTERDMWAHRAIGTPAAV